MAILTLLVLGGAAGIALDRAKLKLARITKARRSLSRQKISGSKQLASTKNKKTMSPAEAEAAHQQYVSLGALGSLVLGALTVPVVSLLALPFFAYNYVYILRMVQKAFQYRSKSKISLALIDIISVSAALWMGYLFTSALLYLTFFTASRLIARSEREAQTDFSRIFGELSDTVWLLKDGAEVEVPLESLNAQDIIVVRAGETISVDGTVISGEGLVDQHLLTGESQPVEKKNGDGVLTSTLLVSGSLHVCVEKQGSETVTGQIAKILENAATFKHQAQSRGERIVERGASLTLLAGAIGLPLMGINRALALGYSGFGYQMRMAAPLMVLNYLRIASNNGILVKDGRALDVLRKVDTIVFDKTGTLTEPVPKIGRVVATTDFSTEQLLQYAASAEQYQEHPIAEAICSHARQQGITMLRLVNSDYVAGNGLRVELASSHEDSNLNIMIGSSNFIRSIGVAIPDEIESLQTEAGNTGFSVVYVATVQGQLVGVIELEPSLRPQIQEAVQALHELNVELYIISGDQEQPTRHLANKLGIDHYFAETLPEDKAKHVEALQNQGRTVCFVGDGINDSVALQKSDVSISLHGASTIAQDTADIVLMQVDLMKLPFLIDISQKLHQRMNLSEVLNNASGIACVSGVVIFGMGVGGAIFLYSSGLFINITNAMLPLLNRANKPEE